MSTPFSPSAIPRSSSLAVPATQGTAPVVKFRCLFTHDMRRKAKRWQDGFLRLHTFNKRVMVYDNTGYFIGDLHWRALEEIQDGDELELDKGVLIQVCEPLERTETDISSLYKNKAQTSPTRPTEGTSSAVRSSTPRPSIPSQQASRSLNDLLGIRKTPTPQLVSPYERRHRFRQPSTQHLHERPTKRQRTASPERNQSGYHDTIDLSDSPSEEQYTRTDDFPSPVQPTTNRSAALPKAQVPTNSSTDTLKKEQPQTQPSARLVPRTTAAAGASETPINTLRLSSDKPRRKLMYQESSQPAKAPQAMTLSRSQSQLHQPTMNREPVSSPTLIILDDDDDPPTPPTPICTIQIKPEPPTQSQSQQKPIITPGPTLSPRHNSFQPPPSSQRDIKPEGTQETDLKPRTTGLRKSYSDPTTINGLHTRPLPAPSPLNPTAEPPSEYGPWTSEALDLFDFWPPGRPKPT
ncbi:hypothetical protein BJX99DRAFT_220229 [Aspergillus californicus]